MDGENFTAFPAMLLTTCIDDERMYASMIARVTYDIVGGQLAPSREQPWILSIEPWDSPVGTLDAEQPFRRGGVDVFVRGEACTPDASPKKELVLAVEVGALRAEAMVFGPRFWRKAPSGKGLVPSDPETFVAAPIGVESAYGGEVTVDGLVVPNPFNPRGLGFYASEGLARDKPLPQLEDPLHLISSWEDRPEPVGFAALPIGHGMRTRRAVTMKDKRIERFESLMFNQAFPALIAQEVSPGDSVTVSGFTHDAPISFVIPPSHLAIRLVLGARTINRAPFIEQVGIDVPNRRVFLGYRYPFRYTVVAHQTRRCTLAPAPPGPARHAGPSA
jgi:hypothetical protein